MFQPNDQPSPATSGATNRTFNNRGGRPKEWTDPRARRLARLYCYTALKVDEILTVLDDGVWSPGKEAANKHLNHLLGKDPRWMRPKDVDEQRQRIGGLKNSGRGRSVSQSSSVNKTSSQSPPIGTGQEPSLRQFQRTGTGDSKSVARSSGSSMEKTDTIMFGQTPPRRTTTTFDVPPPEFRKTSPMNMNNPSFTRFVSGVGRQGTAMTTSTNFSIGSAKEAYYDLKNKLHSYGRADVKDIFRLLKRYTISNEAGSDRSGFSPNSATGGFQQPDLNFRGQTSGVTGIGATKYSLPGDFLNTPTFQYHPVTNTDQFGNTMYHFYAASPQGDGILIGLVSAASDADLNATNTGGQTFLHVLNGSWFEDEMRLTQLVDTLRLRQFNFFAADAYGRTFFHVLRSNMDMNFTRNITRHFNMSQINRRDAFGAKPLLGRASTISGNREPSLLAIPGLVDRNQQKIKEHAQLLSIITGVNDPSRRYPEEDNQGRNALHCLSEVILGMAALDAHVSGTPMKGIKRKMDVKDDPVLQACSLSHRLQFLETVLQANVDVNHYNSQGNTVLMSFVTHIIDGQDDKDLEQLIKRLIEAGANLEARNRSGETVLQVAAKNGQKFAVRVLLEQGANCHVHNSDGRSVLQSVDDMLQLSGEYPEQIARLEATRGVLCGRFSKEKVMQEPSLLQEWAIRSPTIPNLA